MMGLWIFLSISVVMGFTFIIYYLEEHVKKQNRMLDRDAKQELQTLRRDVAALREQVADILLALDEQKHALDADADVPNRLETPRER
jgi:hypothetical protein